MTVLGIQAPAQAAAGTQAGAPASPSSASSSSPSSSSSSSSTKGRLSYESVCGVPKKGDATCFALRRTDIAASKGVKPAAQTPSGYGVSDLQSAYGLPADGGAGQTIAIVDAYDDPNAESDLAIYRQQYGLPACTSADGCFTKLDQRGGTSYPTPDPDWSGEISLDLDMVSATAPNAHILLIEADDTSFDNLGAGVDEAVSLGAKFVSNSYGSDYRGVGGGEDPSDTTTLDAHYNHPGVAVVASSGDYAYGASYPAVSPDVTSVGGTSLVRDPGSTRGWSETAWNSAGSGCSLYEPKPAFQKDTGCANRTVSDVSAVADLATGVSVYVTYGGGGWTVYGGTSVSSPIIAGVYADAGTPVPGTYPNSYPYAAKGAGLNDVTVGQNGTCTTTYLCTAGTGYDGPTGLGTPDGLSAFRSGPHGQLSGTVTDSATGKPIAGATVTAGSGTVQTAADGTYDFSVPVGTYDVTVDAFGYTSGSAPAVNIADGAKLTRDFTLSSVPSQQVTGKVTDGSGHGWPLYAQISVDGAPGAPVWTDPATGSFSLPLPEGHDYTLHVAASMAGYKALTKKITVGDAPQTAHLALEADPFAATAPGYTAKDTGTTETFDSTSSAPQGWKVVNAADTKGGWEFDDPGSLGNHTGGDGAFAVVDSGYIGGGYAQDSQLVSPVYDFTGQSAPEMSFDTDYTTFGTNQTASVDVTTDGGGTWQNVWSTSTSVTGPAKVNIPLTVVAGKANVQLRFHFTGSFGWWWAVDNVFVGQRALATTSGGLVVGNVTDANTGDGVTGSTVTGGDDPDVTATTVATPDDPEVADGFYSLFTPDLGKHPFTASHGRYTSLSKSVNAGADSTVSASFKLQAGQVKVTPGTVDKSVAWGAQTTQKLTVKNTGGAPATLKLGERSGSFQLQALGQGAPLQTIKGTYSPLSSKAQADASGGSATSSAKPAGAAAEPGTAAWQPAPSLPQTVMDNVVSVDAGRVYSGFGYTGTADTSDLYALDPTAGTWTKLASAADTREAPAGEFIQDKLYIAGGWGPTGVPDRKTEIYDPATNKWSTGASMPTAYAGAGHAVLDGKLYAVGGCSSIGCGNTGSSFYDPASDTWSPIADYPEKVSWEACAGISEELYCAGGETDAAEVQHAYVYNPVTNAWSPVADLPAPLWGTAYTSANGELVMSGGISRNALTNAGYAFDPKSGSWSALPNSTVATYRSGGGLGLYKVGGATAPSAPSSAVELLPGFDQPDGSQVSWLSESDQQVTLQPGATSTVTVTLDASVPEITQPGSFDGALTFDSDTPYAVPNLPVTFQVNPPKTWGKITGTVLGLTASGGTAPIAGATVQINSWATSYSLKTATDGTYSLWLDTRNNPLSVIVAKDGFQPTVTTVKLTKGATVTSDFTLKKQ